MKTIKGVSRQQMQFSSLDDFYAVVGVPLSYLTFMVFKHQQPKFVKAAKKTYTPLHHND